MSREQVEPKEERTQTNIPAKRQAQFTVKRFPSAAPPSVQVQHQSYTTTNHAWKITSTKTPMLNQTQLDQLGEQLDVHLLPEMIFHSKLDFHHAATGFTLTFNAPDALQFARHEELHPFRDSFLPRLKVGHAWDTLKKQKEFSQAMQVKNDLLMRARATPAQQKLPQEKLQQEEQVQQKVQQEKLPQEVKEQEVKQEQKMQQKLPQVQQPLQQEEKVTSALRQMNLGNGASDSSSVANVPQQVTIKTCEKSADIKTCEKNADAVATGDQDQVVERDDKIDWTFTTVYRGSAFHGSTQAVAEHTHQKIDYEKLKKKEPILFYEDLVLYEDELHDCGDATLSVKTRIMSHYFFVLLRFFLRVDNVVVRMVDNRFYHEFGTGHVLREFSVRQEKYCNLSKAITNDQKLMTDPARLESLLQLSHAERHILLLEKQQPILVPEQPVVVPKDGEQPKCGEQPIVVSEAEGKERPCSSPKLQDLPEQSAAPAPQQQESEQSAAPAPQESKQ